MKQIQLTLEKAREIFKEGNEAINKMLLANFTEEELNKKGVRDWDDIDADKSFFCLRNRIDKRVISIASPLDKDDWPTKELAEAAMAMSQLAWWMRQPEYNGEDQVDWCDWNDDSVYKYTILFQGHDIHSGLYFCTRRYLAFKTLEIRDRFLEDRRDLIEQAKPLL